MMLNFTLFDYVSVVNSIAMASVCALGSIGNLLSLIIFFGAGFRHISINLLLGSMAVADLVLLVLAIPVFSLAPIVDYLPRHHNLLWEMYAHGTVYLFAPVMMAQFMSIWLLVAATLERWMAVCRPFVVKIYFTTERTLCIIALVVFGSIAFNVIRFWEYHFDDKGELGNLLAARRNYLLVYINILSFTFKSLVPLLIVLIYNARTIRHLIRSSRQRQRMTSVERSTRSTTLMLVYISTLFSCCNTLYCTINLAEMAEGTWFNQPLGFFISDLNNFLWLINSAGNFIFYLSFSTKYRKALKALLCCSKTNNSIQLTRQTTMSRNQEGNEESSPLVDKRSQDLTMVSYRRCSSLDFVQHDIIEDENAL